MIINKYSKNLIGTEGAKYIFESLQLLDLSYLELSIMYL